MATKQITRRKEPKRLKGKQAGDTTPSLALFDNLPEIITINQALTVVPFSRDTIYDWSYRPEKYSVPAHLFVKKNKPKEKTLMRRDVLRAWKCA